MYFKCEYVMKLLEIQVTCQLHLKRYILKNWIVKKKIRIFHLVASVFRSIQDLILIICVHQISTLPPSIKEVILNVLLAPVSLSCKFVNGIFYYDFVLLFYHEVFFSFVIVFKYFLNYDLE